MAVIKFALYKAVRDNIILKKPAVSTKTVKAEEKIHDILTTDEIEKLYKTPADSEFREEIKRAFIFACYTGLRISDLKTLKWENIEHRGDKTHLAKIQTKTKRKVLSELHKTAYEVINDNKLHNRDDYVFPLLSSTNTNINRYLKQWAKKAGIDKNIGWHTARRSIASLLKADPFIIKEILGHHDLKTTQKYVQVSEKAISEAINALPEIKIEKENIG